MSPGQCRICGKRRAKWRRAPALRDHMRDAHGIAKAKAWASSAGITDGKRILRKPQQARRS